MRFANKTGEEITVDALGLVLGVGEEFVVTDAESVGLVLQCGDDGHFEPVDEDAKTAVANATKAEPRESTPVRKATAKTKDVH